jgi:hypothetical protein
MHEPVSIASPRVPFRGRASLRVVAFAAAGLLALGGSVPAAAAVEIELTTPRGAAPTLTHAATVTLAGRVRGDIDSATLRWRADRARGTREVALAPPVVEPDGTRSRAFSLGAVPLQPGRNPMRLEAFDASGQRTVRALSVTRAAPDEGAPDRLVTWRGREVPAAMSHGHLLVQGDIVADAAAPAPGRAGAPTPTPYAIGIGAPAAFWPKVAGIAQIPYVVSQGNDNVAPAIAQYNAALAGVVQFVARGAETDYVDFALDPNDYSGSGFSSVGRVGGRQVIGGSFLADVPTLLHEMGHATGLWHEQSRPDRDAHVTVLSANIIKTLAPNFDVVQDDVQSIGGYDLQSIMQYIPFTFSKNGEPTIETVPPGIRLSDLGTFSAGDLDAIDRLYGHAPAKVTVTSNPPGLQVVVDGATVVTPHAYTFALGSQHTLSVPSNAQLLGGDAYTLGRWSDAPGATHTITIAPGNGLEASPASKPATTVYQADFVQWLPYAPFVYPAGAGTIVATPAPQALPGQGGLWARVRQPLTLKANAAAGYSLYRLYTYDGPASQNPKTTRSPDWVLGYFTTHANTTVTTSPAGRWLWVDGGFVEGPINWSVDYPADGDWTPGTTHHLDVQISPQYPYSSTVRYPWQSWSDAGAFAHDIVVPAGASTFGAAFGSEYQAITWAQPGCAGSVSASPTSVDGFHAQGASVAFDESLVAGWTFSGWLDDLTGTTHPRTLAMTDERLVVAGYNTSATPLAVTSFSPPNAVVGQAGFTLMINGRGFTPATRVFVNGVYRAPVKVTATQVKVKFTAADLKKVGAIELSVDNVPAGSWPCSNYVLRAYQVLASGALPAASPSATALGFASQAVGTTSAPQSITLTNGGTALMAVGEAALTGTNAGDFAVTSDCASSLAAAASCTLQVSFAPKAKGARTARLLLVDSAFDSPQGVTLTGTATP